MNSPASPSDLVDVYASERQYADHLTPIWHALDPSERGLYYAATTALTQRLQQAGIAAVRGRPRGPGPRTLVASIQDLKAASARPCVLVNHGAGQSYDGDPAAAHHPAYSGGDGRDNVIMFLEPGRVAATKTRARYPHIPTIEVGAPKLDPWHRRHKPHTSPPTVAFSFHSPVRICPEAMWAWPHYQTAIETLIRESRFAVLGHGHPRAWGKLERWWRKLDVEPVEEFADILDRADLYVIDNSSTAYEFASTGRPVLLLNAPWYRRNIHHGLRFWDLIPGLQVDEPDQLTGRITEALADPPAVRQMREQVTRAVYAETDGGAAKRAAEAVRHATTFAAARRSTVSNPYAPRRRRSASPTRPPEPELPIRRLQRLGASSTVIETLRGRFAAIDSVEGKLAALDELAATPDTELEASLRSLRDDVSRTSQLPDGVAAHGHIVVEPETGKVADGPHIVIVGDTPIAELIAWVGDDPHRAKAVLAAEQARGPKARTTLIKRLTPVGV